jgi:hypothetical protein
MLRSPVSGAFGDRSGAGVGVDQASVTASVNADRGRVWAESTPPRPLKYYLRYVVGQAEGVTAMVGAAER